MALNAPYKVKMQLIELDENLSEIWNKNLIYWLS